MPGKPPVKPGAPPIRPIDYTVNENDCWVWNWSVERKGYATVRVNGRSLKAHRVSYELSTGPIPEGNIIRHLCGNPTCLNPEHLEAGTGSENMRDMVVAGKQGNQKLTVDDAANIRQIYSEDRISQAELGRRYGVTSSTIRKIIYSERFFDPNYAPPDPRPNRRSRRVVGMKLARAIRKAYAAGGISYPELALHFDIHVSTISRIIRQEIYPEPNNISPARRAANQKLDRPQADEIRNIVESGTSQHHVAKEFNVSQGLVSLIIADKIHHDRVRIYPVNQQPDGEDRPTLQSVNGAAPTGKLQQQNRRETLKVQDRKPRRKPGEPVVISENDWVLDSETGCHNWKWGNRERRPSISSEDGKEILAYRFAWETAFGLIPEESQINHNCNNPRCINLTHLYIGTQFHNMQDTVNVGNHATQKLTWNQVNEIRARYKPGETTYKRLGDEFDVTAGAIYRIIINQTFRDPTYSPRNPETSVRRKLSKDDASSIRNKYASKIMSAISLRREYGVSKSVIQGIVSNRTYRDPD